MKNLFLIVTMSIVVSTCAFAQQVDKKISILKSGKYFINEDAKLISGIWKSADNNFEINVATHKKHIKTGQADGLDFYTDILLVSFGKVIFQEKNCTKKFDKVSIELIGIEGDTFYGSYRDPITQNDVSVSFIRNNGSVALLSKIYTITSIGNVKDGISFPYKLIFKRK